MEFEPRPRHEADDTDSEKSDGKSKKQRRAVLPPSMFGAETPDKEKPASPPAEGLFQKLVEEAEKPKPETAESPAELHETEAAKEDNEPLETLDADERQQAAEAYVQATLPEVVAEAAQAEPESPKAVEAAADEAFLHELQARLARAETPEAAVDEAYEVVAETLGQPEAATTIKPESAAAEAETTPPSAPQSSAPEAPITPLETTTEDPIEGTVPPMPPTTVTAAPPPPPPPAARMAFSPVPRYGFNASHGSMRPAERLTTEADASHRERVAATRGLLVGALVGYFIGRRRGRIKTEKKLIPIQQKLEKQVKELHQKVAVKEQQIRTLAAQKAEATAVVATRNETIRQLRHNHAAKPEATEAAAIAPTVLPAVEHAPQPQNIERTVTEPKKSEKLTAQTAEQASMPVLLATAEAIVVGNQSLKHMYETHQVSERGLRLAIREHLQGGNTHEVIARELVANQLPFERDPTLKQQRPAATAAPAVAASATAASADRTVLPNPLRPQAASQLNQRELANNQAAKKAPNTAAISISAIAAIVLALALIAALR